MKRAVATTRLQRVRILSEALREVLRINRRCSSCWASYPNGTTCFDVQRRAKNPRNRYGDEYRAWILMGGHMCRNCVHTDLARKALKAAGVIR